MLGIMSKRKKVKDGFQHAAEAAKDKLMHVIAAGVVEFDPLDDEEKAMLEELLPELTPEERVEILTQVGSDPWGDLP